MSVAHLRVTGEGLRHSPTAHAGPRRPASLPTPFLGSPRNAEEGLCGGGCWEPQGRIPLWGALGRCAYRGLPPPQALGSQAFRGGGDEPLIGVWGGAAPSPGCPPASDSLRSPHPAATAGLRSRLPPQLGLACRPRVRGPLPREPQGQGWAGRALRTGGSHRTDPRATVTERGAGGASGTTAPAPVPGGETEADPGQALLGPASTSRDN